MKNNQVSQLLLIGSIFAIVGTICYIIAATLSVPAYIGFLLVTIWPMSAIVFAFAIYKYIKIERQSVFNQLAFLFTVIAFVLVYITLSIQIGLNVGIGDAINNANSNEKEILTLIVNSTQWIHLGIDLAWDMFLGISLILLSVAIKGHRKFGIKWTIPMALLGISVILINLYTFPYTPESKGLIDIGPIIGTFMIIFAIHAFRISLKMNK